MHHKKNNNSSSSEDELPIGKLKKDADFPSSEDDVPITVWKSKRKSHTKSYLYKKCMERCEFCDKIFFNRYDHLIHNARHIIIPLLRNNIIQCTHCKFYFPHQNLDEHTNKIHQEKIPEIIKSLVRKEPVIHLKKESVIDSVVECVVKRQPVIRIRNDLVVLGTKDDTLNINQSKPKTLDASESLVNNEINKITDDEHIFNNANGEDLNNFNVLIPTTDDRKNSELGSYELHIEENYHEAFDTEFIWNNTISTADKNNAESEAIYISDDSCGASLSINAATEKEKIKNRIVFEDDVEELTVKNLIVSNKSNGVLSNNNIYNGNNTAVIKNNIASNENRKIYFMKNNNGTSNGENWKSVHYDDLIRPGFYKCGKCRQVFPNRFDCIIHETSHLGNKKHCARNCSHCDFYISGSLLRHRKQKHPGQPPLPHKPHFCQKCGLLYHNYRQHSINYHTYSCLYCCKRYSSPTQLEKHACLQRAQSSEYAGVCELCVSDIKGAFYTVCDKNVPGQVSGIKRAFYTVRDKNVPGQTCKRCFKMCDVLLTVHCVNRKLRIGKSSSSNVERLRKIQRRLKMMKI